MFFNNIDTWSQKKLRIAYITFELLYYILTLVVPIVIVGCRYQIFVHVSRYKLTGWGIILISILLIVGVRSLNKGLNKLPDTTIKEQKVKYTVLGIKALIIPCAIVFVMSLLKDDFTLAYNTIWLCLIFFIAGILVDYLFIKYIEKEMELRHKAKEKIEVDKRVELLKK
ncbi:MAG: hypothetical protein K6A63_02155 [Acholeplasmatales bacterium]|nr:hypothetical protein [Acholeplasmatales bacterium]